MHGRKESVLVHRLELVKVTLFWSVLYCLVPAGQCTTCNTLPRYEYAGNYINYRFDDWQHFWIRILEPQSAMSWEVIKPAKMVRFKAYDLSSGQVFLECPNDNPKHEKCCRLTFKTGSINKGCNSILTVVKTDGLQTVMQYVRLSNATSFETLGIHMQLDTPRGLRRYTHFHIKDPEQMLCPEYLRIGHESDYVQDLIIKLNQPERHEIEFTDMMNEEPVVIKAQVNIHFSMPAFVPNMNYEAVYYLVNKLEWSNEIKVLRKSSTRREKIRPWEVHKMVTELVQAHPEYEEQMYRFHFSFLSKRNIRALIIVLARKGEYMDEALTKLMNRWIVKGEENAKFRWAGTQVPAIRIVPLFVTHLAIYNVGDTAVVEVEPHEIHDEVRYCQKRLFKEQEYERNLRMSSAAGSNKFYIYSVQVEDSGMYKCETPTIHSDPHILIQDHYIIVLPRKTDVTAYVTVQMPTEEDNLENTYPYKDSLDRFYFKQNQPIIITCVYNLSKGLDNYLGYGEAYRTTNPVRHMNYQVLGGHTRSMGNMFLNITSYQVMPEYVGEDQVLETQFQCSYLYEQTFALVRHAKPIRYEDRFIHTEVTLIAVKNKRPLTISSTIQTNVRALTHGLGRVESTFSNLSAYLHTTVRVPETMVIGTFVGLLSEYDGWGQVWLIQKEKNVTSYYSRECRTKWHKVITTKTSAWLHAPEMHLSHSLVTIQFEFSCIFDLHTEAIVFTLLNENDNLVTRNEVAQNFRHSIIQAVTALNKAQEYVPTELTRLAEQTASHIRLIQTTVGWRATLNISDRVHMMWRVSKMFQNFPVHCSYQVNRTQQKELLPEGFSIFQKSSGAIVELSKRSAEITDSGWYRCYIRKCVKCTTELLGPERHLVVLPNESQLKAQVELENKLIDADNVDTKLNPITTEEMKLFVHCSYWMYYGFEANITLGFRYETGIPRSMDQLSLPYKYLRTVRTESNNRYQLKQTYSIDRPDADVYWKYTNVTCFMHISNVIRDEKDVFETDFFLHVTKSIYFNYNLIRFPRFLPQLIQTSSEGLTRSLQQNESTSLEYLFMGNRSIRPVGIYEAGYQLNWTLFLGIPLGWTNIWTIYRKKETILIEPCNNLVLIKLHDATELNNLTAMPLYETNAGINFYNASADCNLQPEHSGLIISAFTQRGIASQEEVEKAFVEEIKRWFSGAGQNVSYASVFRKMNYHVTYRAVVIEVHWRASVRIGDVIMMVGRRSGTQDMPVCQYRETVDRDATPVSNDFKLYDLSPTLFMLQKKSAKYSDSGIYACELNCENCTSQLGFSPRELTVLPDQSILQMHLNSEPLLMNQKSEHNFDQYDESGKPFLYTDQNVSVRCLHEISPIKRLEAIPIFSYRMEHPERKKFLTLDAHRRISFLSKIRGTRLKITDFEIISPSAEMYAGELHFACRLNYAKFVVTSNDLDIPTGRLEVQTEKVLSVRILVPPSILPYSLKSDHPNLFQNWRFHDGLNMSAFQFWHSASTNRFPESYVTFSIVVGLGVPAGWVEVWTYVAYKKMLLLDECEDILREEINSSHALKSAHFQEEFRKSRGRNFVNVTAGCIMHPEHLALSIVSYHSRKNRTTKGQIKAKIDTFIKLGIERFLSNPMDTTPFVWKRFEDSGVAMGLLKLNIGWKASVKKGESMSMLVRCARPLPAFVSIKYRETAASRSVVIARLKCYGPSVYYTRKATHTDSGVYVCISISNCLTCGIKQCFQQRILVVLPDETMTHMFLRRQLVQSTENISSDFLQSNLSTGETLYVYCAQLHPKGLVIQIEETFDYQFLDVSNKSIIILDRIRHPVLVKPTKRGSVHYTPYQITGPPANYESGRLLIRCVAKMDRKNIDPRDVRPLNRIEPVIRSKLLDFAVRIEPVIFTTLVSANWIQLQNHLRVALGKMSKSVEFSQPTTILPEGIYRISSIASLGSPRGIQNAWTFYRKDSTFAFEQCHIRSQVNLTSETSPRLLTWHNEYKAIHKDSLVNTTFKCVIRSEHEGLALVSYSVLSPSLDFDSVKLQLMKSLAQWIQFTVGHPSDRTNRNIPVPTGSMITYALARLTVGWQAFPNMNEPIRMLGSLDKGRDNQIQCFYQTDMSQIPEVVGNSFQIVIDKTSLAFWLVKKHATFTDSGIYTCKVSVSQCDQCIAKPGFIRRRLQVRPDSSVLQLLLTHTQLEKSDNWQTFYSHVDTDGQLYMYTEIPVYAHCLYQVPAGSMLKPYATLHFSAMDENSENCLLTQRLVSTHIKEQNAMQSYYLTASEMDGQTGLVKIACELRYQAADSMRQNLDTTLTNIQLDAIVTIQIRRFLRPHIFFPLTKMKNKTLESLFHRMEDSETNVKQFHSVQNQIRTEESILTVNVFVSLGIPRGRFTSWTYVRQKDSGFIRENCFIEKTLNVTRSEVPLSMYTDQLYKSVRAGCLVNVTMHCVLRPEHVALTLLVHNTEGSNQEKTESILEQRLHESLQAILGIENSDRQVNETTNLLQGVTVNFRMIRLVVQWLELRKIGSSVQMLGYVGKTEDRRINCFTQGKSDHLGKPVGPAFHIVRILNGFAFYLIKTSIEFIDSGDYWCTVSEKCRNCAARFGFLPRRLSVAPDESIVEILLNHKQFGPNAHVTANFTQCKSTNEPYLFNGQTAYVYCRYPELEVSRAKPSFNFRYISINPEKNRVIEQRSTFLFELKQDLPVGHRIVQGFLIQAPMKAETGLYLNVTCTVKYTRELPLKLKNNSKDDSLDAFVVSRSRKIAFYFRFRPRMLTRHIGSSNKNIQQAFREQKGRNIVTAPEFHQSGPKGRILEGLVQVSTLLTLGSPEGIPSVKLLYGDNILRADRCKATVLQKLQPDEIPFDIKKTKASSSDEELSVFYYSASCRLTSSHMAIVIMVINSFDLSANPRALEWTATMSIIKGVTHWMKNRYDLKEVIIRPPPNSYLDYAVSKIRVGWRATIVTGEPMVIFGLLGPSGEGNPICQFYDSSKLGLPSKIIKGDTKEFILAINRTAATFELIKPVALERDGGIYSCQLLDCAQCSTKEEFPDRELIVFSDQMKLFLHYTFKPHKNNTAPPVDVYNQLDKEGVPFIYTAQTIFVHCECRAGVGTKVPIGFRFQFREYSDTKPPMDLPYEISSDTFRDLDDQWSYIKTYRISGPKPHSSNGRLETLCELYYDYDRMKIDVNHEIGSDIEIRRRVLNLVVPVDPYIMSETIWTQHNELTTILQWKAAKEPNSFTFLGRVNREPVEEGPFRVSVTVNLGRPSGWSAVWVLVNRSSVYRAKPCIQIKEEIPEIPGKTVEQTNILNRTYECYIQPEYFAILIYALQVSDVEFDRKQIDQAFVQSTLKVVAKWFENPSDSEQRLLQLPARSFGTYLLCRISVAWKASVPLHSPIQMFGVLDADSKDPIVCQYGSRSADQPLVEDSGFEILRNRSYFYLRKPEAQFHDSGIYECRLKACSSCPGRFGLPSRQLIILPESSIVDFRFDSIRRGTKGDDCGVPSVPLISPGEGVIVSCKYSIPKGSLRKTTSNLYLKTSEANGIEHQLQNALLNLQKEGPIILVERTVTIQIPQQTQQSKQWRIRCEVVFQAYRVPQDIVPEIPIQVVNQFLQFTPVEQRHVNVFVHTFSTNIGEVTQVLRNTDLTRPNKASFLAQSASSRIQEGVLTVKYLTDMGSPPGWTIAWMIYRQNDKLEKDECLLDPVNKIFVSKRNMNKYYCSLIPGHVALLVGALQISGSNWTRQGVEQSVESELLSNLTEWLQMRKNEASEIKHSACFNRDLRLLRLDVGWKATVHVGNTIIMMGRMTGQSIKNVHCFYGASNSNVTTNLSELFTISIGNAPNIFRLIKYNADYKDSGWYSCSLDASNESSLIVGMKTRRLIVLPQENSLNCKLTLDQSGNDLVRDSQITENEIPYLLAYQTGYFHCIHDTQLDVHFRPKYDVSHEAKNDQTRKVTHLLGFYAPRMMESKGYGKVHRTVYSIRGIPSKKYTGLLKVSCTVTVENLTTELDINSSSGTVAFSCMNEYTILEPATGQLHIHSDSPNFYNQPVPLGTEFICSGGHGLPRLTYKWLRVFPPLYKGTMEDFELASWLPGQRGGWDGPELPFTDMPSYALQSDGPILRVPKNNKYKGMNYFYICKGSNIVRAKESVIRKALHISILICYSDGIVADYVIFMSQRLMAACSIRNSPDSQMQFYGYFFNALVRQVVLGLPYGAESARIQYLHRRDEDRTTNRTIAKYSWNSFSHMPDRQILVSRIYSKQLKPVTAPNSCATSPDNLENIIRSLVEMRPKDSARRYVVWLTFDSSLNTTLSSEAIKDIHELRLAGTKFVVALTHPLSKKFDEFNQQIVELLNPKQIVNILPNFQGTTNCWSCRPSLNDPTLRIQRLPLFDALCKAAGCAIPRALPKPFFVFSSAPTRLIEGQDMFISCVASEEPMTYPVVFNELGLCRTTHTAISRVNISNMDMQELRRVCHQQLSKSYSDHMYGREKMFYFGTTARIRLTSEFRNALILCYRRHGQFPPKIFDPINGVTYQLAFAEGNIVQVRLRPVMWLSTELKAASFECSVQGTGTNLVAELLVQRNTNGEDGHKRYEIIGRKSLTISVFDRVDPVNLTWLEVPEHFDKSEVICLVRPDSKSVRKERYLDSLPISNRRTRTSTPIETLLFVPQCPAPPLIKVKTHSSKLRLGSRFEASCVAATTADGLPLKLYYLTPKLSIIICTKMPVKSDDSGIPVVVPAPCESTTSHDKDCTSHQYVDRTYYPTRCEAVRRTEHKTLIRTIRFAITKLRPEDMDGRLFCQTINVYSMQSSVEQFRAPRLHSRVHVMRFKLKPQIWSFIFLPELQEWTCTVLAYPMYTEPLIRLLHATPVYLQTQLEVYSSSVNLTQPTIVNAHLLPTTNGRGSAIENEGSYYARIKFHPDTFRQGGLRYGNATLSCSFDGFTKVLVTRLGEKEPAYEPLMQKHLVTKAGRQVEFICSAVSIGRYRASQISLVRKVRHSWLNYDLTLVVLTLKEQNNEVLSPYDSLLLKMSLFGPWLYTRKESVRVLTGESDTEIGVDVGLLNTTEFDSGTYHCSNWSPRYVQMNDNAINKTIVGDKKHMAFGQRLLSNSLTFRSNEIRSILVGHLLHLRCIAWSTIPSERRLEQFYMLPQNKPISSNRTTKDNPIQSAIVISQIDHYQLMTEDSELHHVGCLMTDGKRESQILLPGPRAECEAPNDLRWYPDDQFSHSQSSEIVCNTKVGCSQPKFQWRWIAGPVPQITHVDDQTYRIVEPGPVLNLSRLPRSGTYVFRCTVTCLCSDGLKTQSIQASFHMHLEDTASVGTRESDPSLDGLDKNITLVSRPEDTTISGVDSDLQQKSPKERKTENRRKALDTLYADSKEMESYHTTLLQRHKKHECLEDLKNHLESDIQKQVISLINLFLDSPRLEESAEMTSEGNPKFLPYKTEYLGYAIRPTYNFRSRIVRGCNRFMSSTGERCPRNFDYYTEISNFDVAGRQRITDAIIQGLAYIHISREVQRQNQGEKRNTEPFDDLTKELSVYFLDCIKRQQQPNKVSQIYLEKSNVSETPTRRLKQSLNEPGNVMFRTDKNLLADIYAVSDGALCGERCSPKEQAKHQREVIQSLSEVEFKMELVPLGYRESLFGRGGLEDTRWDDMRAFRERERRKFVYISKDDKSPLNPELLNSLDLFEDQTREVERGAVESKGRTLLHLHDWNQHLSRTPVDRLDDTNRKTVRSEYTEELFDRRASNDPIHMNEHLSRDFTDNRIRLTMDNVGTSDRFFDFVNETMSAVHRGFPTNFGHFDWAWLNFSRKFVSRSRDRLLSEIQNDEHEEEENREYLRIEPGLVKLPSTTTAICPISAVPKDGNYRLAKLMWLRLPHANSLHDRDLNEVEEIIYLGMDRREIKPLLLRFNSPNRVYAYPPKRWADAFTLDITNLNINDFGFYACVITFEARGNLPKFVNVTKRARYPLCIIPNQPRPKLHVTRAIGGLVNQTDEVVDCLSPDEEIFLSCEVEPFQIFCEKSDHLANGSLLFDTKFYGHVFLTEFGRRTRRINLQSTNNSIRQPFTRVKRHFQTKHHTWGLRLMPEHDGAYVDCEVLPHLVLPPYGMPDYWGWLARRLKKFGMKKLRRVSKPLKLCIEPLTNPVRIYPEPQSHYARPFRLLALPPQQMLACRAHQVPMVYPNLSIFPIVDGSIEKALMHGLNQSQFWVDQNKMPIRWTAIKKPNEVRMLIPGDANVLGIYYVLCFAGFMNTSEEFILEVYPPATEFWVDFEISKSWLIIILPAGFMLYAALKRCSRQRRTTTKTHSSSSVDSTRKTTVSHKSDLRG